jgi:CheY-like chemotaxis protein
MKKLKSQKIGLLINDEGFKSHIEDLRKKGINANRLEVKDPVDEYTCILVDLNYPKELGYTFIDIIESNQVYGHISIIAIVSNQKDLEKITNLQSSRVFGFIDKNTDFENLLKKIKLTLDFDSLPRRKYSEDIIVQVEGEVTHISESGALIKSDICFAPNVTIDIEIPLLNDVLDNEAPLFNISKLVGATNNKFTSEVNFLNISTASRKKLRKLIYGWSVK